MNLSTTTHTARKEHACIWCREPIKPGEKYTVDCGVYCGDWQANKYHDECYGAASGEDLSDGFEPHSFKRGTTEEA